jgi:hypothetical protein
MQSNQYLAPIPGQGMHIALMFIADTGTYDQQWRRPYQTVFDRDAIASLQERLAQVNNVVPAALAGVVSGTNDYVVAPQVQPERPIQMINGWDSHKFRWLAIAENIDRLGVKTFELITGYTDDRGISMNNSLDPNMSFFITNVLTLRHTTTLTPGGQRTYFNVADSSQLLVADDWQGVGTNGTQYRLRPTDMFTAMDRTHLEDDMLRQGIVDTRNMMTGNAVKSRRSNGVATAYAAGIIQNYKTAQTMDTYGQSEDQILDYARGNTLEPPVTNDMFIRAISRERGVPQTSFFTWGDLCRLDPNVQDDRITKVVLMGSARKIENTMYNRGQANDWGAATRENQLATILQQAVPAIMMDLALSNVVFKATNRTIGGQIEILIGNWQDFPSLTGAQIDMTEFIQAFVARLRTEVLIDLSFNGQADFDLMMNVDLLAETIIELEWNGGDLNRWVVPSFADSLLTPLVTNDVMRPTHIARQFQGVFDGVLGTTQNHEPEGNEGIFDQMSPSVFGKKNDGGNNGGGSGYGLI